MDLNKIPLEDLKAIGRAFDLYVAARIKKSGARSADPLRHILGELNLLWERRLHRNKWPDDIKDL